ncbi:MAG: TIGR03435 family protein [Vicinamibacterales bacterium]
MRYLSGVLAVLVAPIVFAQDAASPAFDVVSIKPHNPALHYTSSGSDGVEWTATNFSLLLLLREAYPDYNDEGRIVVSEPWMRQTTFDIRAKGTGVLAYPALHGMIQRLLADRFRLRAHTESRSFDVYVARLTRPDGTPGPWLVPTPPECVETREKEAPRPSSCERLVKAREAEGGRRALTLLALTVPDIFQVFRQVGGFDRPVVDRTGLIGRYDVSVRYEAANPLDAPTGGVSLTTAAREQLGVRFDPGREMLDVLVIDSAIRPEPD